MNSAVFLLSASISAERSTLERNPNIKSYDVFFPAGSDEKLPFLQFSNKIASNAFTSSTASAKIFSISVSDIHSSKKYFIAGSYSIAMRSHSSLCSNPLNLFISFISKSP